METALLGIVWYAVFLLSTTIHEAAHAWAASRGGDLTAYHGGQVSLDPMPHIRQEPLGTVIVPIVSYVLSNFSWMIGWASTPYDPFWADRHPHRAAWMSLAGPAANLMLVVAAALAIRLGILLGVFSAPDSISFTHVVSALAGGWLNGLAVLLSILFTLNVVLFVFNLLPVPPLDGSGVVALFMSEDLARRYQAVVHQPVFMWVGLLVAWKLFGVIFSGVHLLAINLLYPGAMYR
jgi:Zn-dependent protease